MFRCQRYFDWLKFDLWIRQAKGASGCIPILGSATTKDADRRQQEEPHCATHSENISNVIVIIMIKNEKIINKSMPYFLYVWKCVGCLNLNN